jgi:hypothetical protein
LLIVGFEFVGWYSWVCFVGMVGKCCVVVLGGRALRHGIGYHALLAFIVLQTLV